MAGSAADRVQIEAAVAGDEAALSVLLEHHGVAVRQGLSISPKWQSQIDPDDVMQVTYLEAFLRIGDLKRVTTEGFVAWLRTIAENNLRDALRAMECEKRPQDCAADCADSDSYTALLHQISGTSTTPSRAAGRREVQQLVEDALRKLPADYERVLRVCELDSKSGLEAAAILGRSHGAVRMLLARAKDRLRDMLASESSYFSDTA